MTGEHVLFILGSQACVPEDPLQAARKLGLSTTIFAPTMPCGDLHSLADRCEFLDPRSPDSVTAAAVALNAGRPINGVVAYDDQAVPAVARVAAELDLPGHPVAAADAAADKPLMKGRFLAAGVPIAPYTLARDVDDAVRWAATSGYPVVVKPVRGSASQGVIRADSESELRQAYRRLRRIVATHGLDTGGRSDREQLVEKYLSGHEISVEALVRDGVPEILCVFDKPRPLEGPYFEETIYRTPSLLPEARLRRYEELATAAIRALGLRHGAAHCEIRFSDADAFVIEVGARLIGGACSRVFRYLLEEDIHELLLGIALGRETPPPRRRAVSAGSMMLPIRREGQLVRVEGTETAAAIPEIQDVIVSACPGDLVVSFPEQSCYIGFLTAAGERPEEVDRALAEAAEAIHFVVEPVDCQWWSLPLDGDGDYSTSAERPIESLAGLSADDARRIVRPLVARTNFGEYPDEEAQQEADKCIDWLVTGSKGETSPDLWLIVEDRGVVLGSTDGTTGFASCLGVIPGDRRSGVGSSLVRRLMGIFAARGCAEMRVFVDPRDPHSSGLFRHLGFRPREQSLQSCCEC